jgi:hypothetical protein
MKKKHQKSFFKVNNSKELFELVFFLPVFFLVLMGHVLGIAIVLGGVTFSIGAIFYWFYVFIMKLFV